MSIMSVHKTKRLFTRAQYPLHYSWLELIEKSINASSDQEDLSSDVNYVSKIMGSEYIDALKLILNSDSQLPYNLIPLKISAKKCIASNGKEFGKNYDKIKSILSKYVSVEFKTLTDLYHEQRQIQEQIVQARREASEKMFQELKAQYERNYIDFPLIGVVKIRSRSKAATVLKALTKGKVISDSDYLWLINKGFDNQQVRKLYYLNRAKTAECQWDETKKPWNLVNAIADYRKAGESQISVELINKNFPFKFANGKKSLKSALLTTSGGAKRDLRMFEEAIKLGNQAHELTPQDYRPCTLIGACKMMLGDITQGHQWYQKAIKRGFNEDSFEQEIRSIYNRASQKDKARIKQILTDDGWTYKWLK
ncbi:hypothetical protein [Photobacterium damselae]|uniref:Uncharacterized protein n=1 Tax=Photobacterium damselae subsp. damselae TaxID=85581 RepID=A0AAD3ZV81_PHODD|nr:hypothetical protein [Photobacterium damselae]KAB1181447.1 hypothetical protein F6450_08835 [Photobacterium damselae subsp. damselae]